MISTDIEDDLFDQTRILIDSLRELDIETAERRRDVPAASAPAKSGTDLVAAAAVVVTLFESPELAAQIVQLIADFVRRRRSIKIEIDGVLTVEAENLDRKNTATLIQALVRHLDETPDDQRAG